MLSLVCLLVELILGFATASLTHETGGLAKLYELASTTTLVLQVNRLTKYASHPNSFYNLEI